MGPSLRSKAITVLSRDLAYPPFCSSNFGSLPTPIYSYGSCRPRYTCPRQYVTPAGWYVSNVSITFDAPCLFIHYLLWVLLHFVVFYAFSGTNLLTRCHSASSLFSAVFVFQKSYTGNILGIGRNKSRTSYFYRSFTKTEDETKGGQEPGSPPGGAAIPWPCCPMVRPAGPTSDDAFLPISSPRQEKPKRWISFPRNILQAAAIAVARSGGSRSSSQHPAGEGNPCWRPSKPPWSPPEWCVSSLPWTMGP
jgi:hypothetical protein